MASAPQLPLFYKGLEPLSSDLHRDFKLRIQESAPFLAGQHAVPITVEEFPLVQRHMPIVFSVGADAIPLALMGLNEGVNVFVDDGGKLIESTFYVPAYVRRYPFMLAKLQPDTQELSLCFDATAEGIGAFEDGEPLFSDGQPSELTRNILAFNEQFEQAGQRTHQFMTELKELDLLMDGEVSIQPEGVEQPFIYRGFQMVNEEKLREMRGDQLRKINQSLSLMRDVFARQVQTGKAPQPQA